MNLAQTISSIKNSVIASKPFAHVKVCKQSIQLLDILQDFKYIHAYFYDENKEIKVFLKYTKSVNSIHKLVLLHKPSYPVYVSTKNLWKFEKSYGVFVVNTSQGLITHKKALQQNIGGQAVLYIL